MELKQKIYSKLKQVPKGKVITYKELAKSVDSKAYRFVGQCMAQNTNLENIPCYKVVKSDGQIGEYSGREGVKGKIKLLERDGVKIIDGKVDLEKFGWSFR
ncbi:MGMT family protein [Candidatus Pacearchaeota archaeon]|nr:MGMT family protein [Candidatus Pacearchaeota archaeon]